MLDKPVIFETRVEEVEAMEAPELICFISNASSYLVVEALIGKNLEGDAKQESIEKILYTEKLLDVAKASLRKYF